MKLSPPASSSDLDVARGIARRIHHRARGTEAVPDSTPAPAASPPPAPPAVARPPKRRAPEPPPRLQDPVAQPPESEQELTDPNLVTEPPELDAPELEPEPPERDPPEPESERPEWAAPGAESGPSELAAAELEPELELDASEPPDLPGLEPASFEPEPEPEPEPAQRPPEPLFEPDLPELTDELSQPVEEPAPAAAHGADTGEFQPGPPGAPDTEEGVFEQLPPGGYGPASGSFEAPSNEEPSFGGDDASDEEDALADLATPPPASELEDLEPPEPGLSPEDLLSDEPAAPGWSDPAALEAEMVGGEDEPEGEAEAPVEAASPWDEIADSCLTLAPANGAMLVDPAGQVLTARGDWPEPGPEAIAGRLVSMMEKKLRDAPTRSVSAPLAGQHLTAWRVPAADGYLTVVFMADAPLKADVRPAIDTAVQAAGG